MDVDVLERVWGSWAERGAGLSGEEWGRATRLDGWTVLDLFAHVAPDPKVLDFFRGARVVGPAVTGGAELLRVVHAADGVVRERAGEIASAAREAGGVGVARLLRYFTVGGPEAIAVLREADSAAGLGYPQVGSVSFGALVEVSIVEATVHLLDLIAAVGGPPVPAGGLRRTVEVLAAVPDPVVFIESAAGRTAGGLPPILG
ncbi:maleylpyruvate isomerase N-terminal domain-containing protein [Nocardia sp. BMG111209]|uniref:maleylpyruvate isomerase N-terminal domain-containing protein n=1 Tax=Nocardia sp. BMG111209 TaxID=1160137 RepID=UPI0003793D33|nr:maleylpyruvate isomerase N-terminal domain-containing protein [Nocardia sp. BMG111209]